MYIELYHTQFAFPYCKFSSPMYWLIIIFIC